MEKVIIEKTHQTSEGTITLRRVESDSNVIGYGSKYSLIVESRRCKAGLNFPLTNKGLSEALDEYHNYFIKYLTTK